MELPSEVVDSLLVILGYLLRLIQLKFIKKKVNDPIMDRYKIEKVNEHTFRVWDVKNRVILYDGGLNDAMRFHKSLLIRLIDTES